MISNASNYMDAFLHFAKATHMQGIEFSINTVTYTFLAV